jgi:hypothetical protein
MLTIIHENDHAYQKDTIDGNSINEESKYAETWNRNFHFYINTDNEDYGYLYPIQPIERHAFKYSEKRIKEIFEKINPKDIGYRELLCYFEKDGYEAQYKNAKQWDKNKNLEKFTDDLIIKAEKKYLKTSKKSNPEHESTIRQNYNFIDRFSTNHHTDNSNNNIKNNDDYEFD